MSHPYLRAATPGDILSRAFRLFRENLSLLIQVSLWPSLVMLGVQTLVTVDENISPPVFLGFALLTVLLKGVALVALTHAGCRAVLETNPGVRVVYARTFQGRIAAPLVLFLMLIFLAYFPISLGLLQGNLLMFMLGLMPSILAGALLFPALPISVVENRGVLSALGRSVSMMRGKLSLGIAAFGFYVFITDFLPAMALAVQITVGLGPLTLLLFALIGAVTLPLGFGAPLLVYLSVISEEGAGPSELAAALGLEETDENDPKADDPRQNGAGQDEPPPEA